MKLPVQLGIVTGPEPTLQLGAVEGGDVPSCNYNYELAAAAGEDCCANEPASGDDYCVDKATPREDCCTYDSIRGQDPEAYRVLERCDISPPRGESTTKNTPLPSLIVLCDVYHL